MIAAIVVLYFPDRSVLKRLLTSIADQVDLAIAVDNTPGGTRFSSELFSHAATEKLIYVALNENTGIGKAQNIGIKKAIALGASHVLLLDQDSELPAGMVGRLYDAELSLANSGVRVGVVAPQVVEDKSGIRPCAVEYRWFRARKVFKDTSETLAVPTDNAIASGSLIRVETLQRLGLMREDLFIEYVDTEWALRAKSAGYQSFCIPNAVMNHMFGEDSKKLFGQDVYVYSHIRYYYKLRNAVYLMGVRTMGWHWRAYTLARLPYHFVIYSVFSSRPLRTVGYLLRALRDGFLGRLGPLVETAAPQFSNKVSAS